MGWFLRSVLGMAAVGAAGAASRPTMRDRAGDLGRRLAREARDVADAVTAPAEYAMEVAREKIVGGLPHAADTKWRVLHAVIRGQIVDVVSDEDANGAALDAGGREYAALFEPDGGWTPLMLAEVSVRLVRALDMEGPVRRHRDGAVEIVTDRCPLVEAVPGHEPVVCEVVCGEHLSLLHGLATSTGATLEAPLRMGEGAEQCSRILRLPPRAPKP